MATEMNAVTINIEEQNPQIQRAIKFLIDRRDFREISFDNFLQIAIELLSISKGPIEDRKEFIIQTINTLIDQTESGNDDIFDPIFKTMVASVVPQFLDYALNMKVECSKSCLSFFKK